MTVVEQSTAVPDIDVKMHYVYQRNYCPFEQDQCVGEICKFWYGTDCIIAQSLIKVYQSGVIGRD
jgi:hypothetical protein